jgi:hypothetical protein
MLAQPWNKCIAYGNSSDAIQALRHKTAQRQIQIGVVAMDEEKPSPLITTSSMRMKFKLMTLLLASQ